MTFQKTQIEPPMLNDVPAAFLRDQKEKGLCLCWLDQRTTRAAQAWIKKAWAEFRKEIISNSHPPIGGIFCYDCCECRGDYAKNDGTGAMVERLLLLLRLRLCTDPAFLRYRTLGRGFCCRASLRPARFLRYRSRRSHAAHSRRGRRFPALPFGRSGGNRRSLCASLRYRLFCAAALCGNWALRSVLLRLTRRIRPRGRARRCTSFAAGRRRCRRYRRCGCGMLPICRAAIHARSAGRLHRAAGLLG